MVKKTPSTETPAAQTPSPEASIPLAVEERIQALVDEGGATADALCAQIDFWYRMRSLLAANESSQGLQALDDLALSVLVGDDAALLALPLPVTILLPADFMLPGEATPHVIFDIPEVEVTPPTRTRKRQSTRSKTKGKGKAPPAKKRRTSKKVKSTPTPTRYELKIRVGTPDDIHRDLAKLLKKAAYQGVAPFHLAYPWSEQRAWYDPNEYPNLHLAHWRFFMRCREFFFWCALYPPTIHSETHRKQKSNVLQCRMRFVGLNILVLGYYGFLDKFKNSPHDTLMWLGGRAAKHSKDAKNQNPSAGPVLQDLTELYKRDLQRYDRTIARALDPYRVDEDGYTSIREFLEQSRAMDVDRDAHLRLSDEALARIAYDVSTRPCPNPAWVGNRTTGVWKRLLSSRKLFPAITKEIAATAKAKAKDPKYQPPSTEKPYKPDEKKADWSDFENEDGHYTVLPPSDSLTVITSPVSSTTEELVDETAHSDEFEEKGDKIHTTNDAEGDSDSAEENQDVEETHNGENGAHEAHDEDDSGSEANEDAFNDPGGEEDQDSEDSADEILVTQLAKVNKTTSKAAKATRSAKSK